MNNSNFMLVSLGFGMILLVVLDIQLPIYLSLGIAIFVTIIAFYDYLSIFQNGEFTEIEIVDKFLKNFYLFLNVVRVFVIPASVPLAIFLTHIILKQSSLTEIKDIEQSLTVYSLGLLLMTIGFKKN